MLPYISRVFILGAFIGLSGCATSLPTEHHMDAGARQHIKSVDGVLIAKQSRIGADVERNATLSQISSLLSGITPIPLLVDMSVMGVRTAEANKLAKPMRKTLEGHDYAWEFKKQVKHSVAGTLDGVDDFMIVREEYPGLRAQLIQESDADAVLVVDMKYGFTPNFGNLYVQSYAMLFPNNPELKPFQEKPDKDRVVEFSDNIYRNQFVAHLSTKLPDASKEENAAFWADLSEEQLVDLLQTAGLMMADTMSNDIRIDDVESDLNLIPDGYRLNTKFDNFNAQFAKTRGLDPDGSPISDSDMSDQTEPESDVTVTEGES